MQNAGSPGFREPAGVVWDTQHSQNASDGRHLEPRHLANQQSPSSQPIQHSYAQHAVAPPNIERSGPGRKSRACTECKRQKMKCEITPGSRKCKHCLRRSIDCSLLLARPSATSRPEDASIDRSSSTTYDRKIDLMRNEISQMRSSLDTLVHRGAAIAFPADKPSQYDSIASSEVRTDPRRSGKETMAMTMAMTRENSADSDLTEQGVQTQDSVTVDEPMSSLYEVTRLRSIRSNAAKTIRPLVDMESGPSDFISRGVVSEREAQELYITFHTSLNHYLWVGLGIWNPLELSRIRRPRPQPEGDLYADSYAEQIHASLQSVRRSSELLTATILAVTALHIPTSAETFDKLCKEFLSLISSSMFMRYHNIDDVRGLCIAAFWISEFSWTLSGLAVRIATELGIHQSFFRALDGDREHFLRARLWYMLYVCDRHFSIAYGRPPMIPESLQIRKHELFLQVPLADALDRRVLSQVSLFQILTRIHNRFVERRLPDQGQSSIMLDETEFGDMRSYNVEIDEWLMKWCPRQEHNHFIGSFPPKGNIMYSYFAKLQLNSLALRGVSTSHGLLSPERKELANEATSAAASIIAFVLDEEDMRRALVGMPLYFHSMIAFASVFLLKLATKWNHIVGLNVDSDYIWELLERMIALMNTSITSDCHLLHYIASGLEKMLARSRASTTRAGAMERPTTIGRGMPTFDSQAGCLASTTNHPLMTGVMSAIPDIHHESPGYARAGEDMTIMNDSWIHEAFGSNSSNDVYNLLTSQFSY